MQHIVVDANVLISFFVERNEKQRAAAKAFLLAAENGDFTVVIPQFVFFEIIYVLQTFYSVPVDVVANVVKDVLAMPGILVTDDFPWTQIFEYWPDPLRSISDAAIVALAVANRYDSVATFDQKLARRLKTSGVHSYW